MTVNDNGALSSSDTAIINITAVNDAPVITSNSTVNFAENATGTVYTVTSTDPDAGATKTYSLSGGADVAKFDIDSITGAVTFKTSPNYESPIDSGANNVYDINVRVSDGTLTDTKAVAITVTNVGEDSVNDILVGTTGDDILSGLSGNDTITGGLGADTMTGGSGSDTFKFVHGDSDVSAPTLSTNQLVGLDVIKDFQLNSSSAILDKLDFDVKSGGSNSVRIATDNDVDGANIGGISAHKVASNGEVSFYDASSGGNASGNVVNLDTQAKVNSAAQYLIGSDLGDPGSTVFFKALGDTYVYSQYDSKKGSDGGNGGYSFVKLEGISASGLETSNAHTDHYIHIE
jgi:Ca2+-binding RTX toxin-like protein